VVDKTGLEGVYDFRLQRVGRGQLPPGPEGLKNSLSIFSSIEKQLGVLLVPDTADTPVLTVARANRVPAANPPWVTEKLGRTPTDFDVAEVRPSGPDEHQDFNMENGRIEAKAIALRDLIEFAYDAEDDALRGGPRWLDSERFDIVAKTAPTESADTLRVMLQRWAPRGRTLGRIAAVSAGSGEGAVAGPASSPDPTAELTVLRRSNGSWD
jgi:hypothetical protein